MELSASTEDFGFNDISRPVSCAAWKELGMMNKVLCDDLTGSVAILCEDLTQRSWRMESNSNVFFIYCVKLPH